MGNRCCKRKGVDLDDEKNATRRPLVKADGESADDSIIQDEIEDRTKTKSFIKTQEIELVKTTPQSTEKDILELDGKEETDTGTLTEVYDLNQKELSIDATKAETTNSRPTGKSPRSASGAPAARKGIQGCGHDAPNCSEWVFCTCLGRWPEAHLVQ